MTSTRTHLAGIATVALATMTGIHVFTGFVAAIVWSIGADRPAPVMGAIAFAVYAVGLAGWIAAPRLDGPRAGSRRVLLFAAAYVLSHLVKYPVLTPVLALAAMTAWAWFLPALISRLTRTGLSAGLAPGFVAGIAAQVALQTSLHGLDLAMLRGVLPGVDAAVLAACLFAGWRTLREAGDAAAPGGPTPGWGLVAFGPYLVLQLVLLANVGRAEVLTGAALPVAAVPILLGLAAGTAVAVIPGSTPLRTAAAVVSVLAVQPGWMASQGAVLFCVAQIALSITLADALRPGAARPGTTLASGAAGLLAAFILLFLYYSRYEWPALWPVLAALVAAPALVRRASARAAVQVAAATAVGVIVVGVVGVLAGSVSSRHPAEPAQLHRGLRVLDYNIHMGFDVRGLPDPLRIAGVIAGVDADIVALQEVGRGWTVNGGADLFAWLRWRFPQYRAVYGPMNGALWGNAILSRYPLRDRGSVRFPLRKSPFQRGLTWVTIPSGAGELLVVAVHFSHEANAEADRIGQAGDLLSFWASRPRTVIMGDLNAGPDSAPLTRLLASGLRDALGAHGLDAAPTFPSHRPDVRIDYVLISPDLESAAGSIPRTTASDHLPTVVQITMP